MENRRLSLLYNLQTLYNAAKLGSVEHLLSKYLLDNYQKIGQLNIFVVSEENNVSRATVRRFCQLLGYANFKELKNHFSEFDEGIAQYHDFYQQVDFLSKLKLEINTMFDELQECLTNREITQVVNRINMADEVIIIASSNLANNMRYFQQTMIVFGKRIRLVVSHDEFKALCTSLTNNSLILFFSITGLLAKTFVDEIKDCIAETYLFTNSRQAIFNQCFRRVYHLSSLNNLSSNHVIYYTYGITYVLDLILHKYRNMTLEQKG